jgi:hypothetical protein
MASQTYFGAYLGCKWRVSLDINQFKIRETDEYEEPLSSKATALLEGAPWISVVTGMVFSCTIKESTSTFHRDGELMGHVEIGVEFATLAYSGSYSPIHLGELASIQQFSPNVPTEKLPWISSVGSESRCNANAIKFGWLGLSWKRLKSRLRPVDSSVLLTRASIVDKAVKPSPRIPFAPYPRAGFWAVETSMSAWLGTDILETI